MSVEDLISQGLNPGQMLPSLASLEASLGFQEDRKGWLVPSVTVLLLLLGGSVLQLQISMKSNAIFRRVISSL